MLFCQKPRQGLKKGKNRTKDAYFFACSLSSHVFFSFSSKPNYCYTYHPLLIYLPSSSNSTYSLFLYLLYCSTFTIKRHLHRPKHDNFGYSCVLWVVCGFTCSDITLSFLNLIWWSNHISDDHLSSLDDILKPINWVVSFWRKLTTIPFRNCGGFGECEKMKKNCDHYAWPCD